MKVKWEKVPFQAHKDIKAGVVSATFRTAQNLQSGDELKFEMEGGEIKTIMVRRAKDNHSILEPLSAVEQVT